MTDLDEARFAIKDALKNRTHGVRTGTTGPGPAPLHLSVIGADEAVARELHVRFGDLIEIEVAGHRYPFDSAGGVSLAPQPRPNANDYGLAVTTLLHPSFDDGVKSGSIIAGRVEITNMSGSRIE